MRIIISPAKKMVESRDTLAPTSTPVFVDRAQQLIDVLRGYDTDSLGKLMQCNNAIAQLNCDRYSNMSLSSADTPAILSYDGIQYQYMSPMVLEDSCIHYLQQHLVILSGLYGGLLPFDSVLPYRLEMQTRLAVGDSANLYQYWGSSIYDRFLSDEDTVLDLASAEYSKVVKPYIQSHQQYIRVIFGQLIDGKVVEKGVYVKMARGEMVRYLAEHNIDNVADIVHFDRLGYSYNSALSTTDKYVFIKGD